MAIVLEPKYDQIKPFENGFARVELNKNWGIINTEGKELVEPAYAEIGNYFKNTTWARKDKTFGIVNSGKFIPVDGAEKIWDFETQDLTFAKKNGKIGFIDLKGNWVITPIYDKAKAFSKNLAPVCVGSKWGYINPKAEFVIEPTYSDAEVFSTNGLAPVKESNWGFINEAGKLVIPTQYGITSNGFVIALFVQQDKGFINGIARVKNEGKWGFLKPDGTVLGNQWFENAEVFSKSEKNYVSEVAAEKPKQETKQEAKPTAKAVKKSTAKKK
jgi:hypothetical protein